MRIAAAIIGALLAVAANDACAGPLGGYTATLAPRSPEIMLFFSHSIGGTGGGAGGFGGTSRPIFGLRVSQVRQVPNSGDPDAGDGMQHRELFNWQMQAHSDLRISNMKFQLARRITYDVTNKSFGALGARSLIALAAPVRNSNGTATLNAPAAAAVLFRPAATESTGMHNFALSREPFRDNTERDNANFREIAAAAVSALTPAKLGPLQHPVRAPSGRIQAPLGVNIGTRP